MDDVERQKKASGSNDGGEHDGSQRPKLFRNAPFVFDIAIDPFQGRPNQAGVGGRTRIIRSVKTAVQHSNGEQPVLEFEVNGPS